MSKKKRTSNDQRSDVKNPNNTEFKAARDNRSNQLNGSSKQKSRQAKQERGNR